MSQQLEATDLAIEGAEMLADQGDKVGVGGEPRLDRGEAESELTQGKHLVQASRPDPETE